MLRTLAVQNYRSLRELVVALDRVNVVTGPNGSGKSNLYRALRLLAECARNGAVGALAREGGLSSTLWAGPEVISTAVREGRYPVQGTVRKEPVALRLGFLADDLGYAIDLGLPPPTTGPTGSAFTLDPQIKRECVWAGPTLRPAALLADRHHGIVRVRDRDGRWEEAPQGLRHVDSMLSEASDPVRAPELMALRDRIRSWRFYDHFRTDADAPARHPRLGTFTPVLGHDGSDLAAALQSIREAGDGHALDRAIDAAFPGAGLEVVFDAGRFDLAFRQPGLLRPLSGTELSEGTLRYLLWAAALLTPRPPELLVLNEPETSLHPDVLPGLAGLIVAAAERTQIVTVTHSRPLVMALTTATADADRPAQVLELVKDEFGRTLVRGQDRFDRPPWKWPAR